MPATAIKKDQRNAKENYETVAGSKIPSTAKPLLFDMRHSEDSAQSADGRQGGATTASQRPHYIYT